MNTDTGVIYPSREAALAAGTPEDRLVSGTRAALEDLKKRLFPKPRRRRLRSKVR